MTSLLEVCWEFLEVRAVKDFERVLLRSAQLVGFRTFSATLVQDRPDGQASFTTVENLPEAYRSHFYSPGGLDPVMQHCKVSALPIVWGRDTYAAHGQTDTWAFMDSHGLRWGIAAAMHMPRGRHFLIGFDSDTTPDPKQTVRMSADTQLALVYAQAAAERVFGDLAGAARPNLGARELEVLRWTAEGKTAWEVGAILRISERTVTKHLEAATQKLDCVNKLQATVKAMRLGIIN